MERGFELVSKNGGFDMSVAKSATADFFVYVLRVKEFNTKDWLLYGLWISTISSLFIGMTSFILYGWSHAIPWPGYVWFIPIGSGLFSMALAIDDIGHRTVYKEQLNKGEKYVHRMIVITAVGSVVCLCCGFGHPEVFRTPSLALIFLSFFYSAIDEWLHWKRYLSFGLDKVEMWSHFVAIVGHVLLIAAWWEWYQAGYPGVRDTLVLLGIIN